MTSAHALGIVAESDLVVAFDDLDLPLGRLRLRAAGGCGGHRGMESIAAELGSERFARLRFGIGRPPAGAAQRGLFLGETARLRLDTARTLSAPGMNISTPAMRRSGLAMPFRTAICSTPTP